MNYLIYAILIMFLKLNKKKLPKGRFGVTAWSASHGLLKPTEFSAQTEK